ncbi:MAG: hypothetical protein VKI63_05630 [Cyanobium sp.]|nr:hypothetical protein [Cyanobium sp.]
MSGRKSKQRAHGARTTMAEKQAMFWLARTGKNYKDIGSLLGVSSACVQHHVVRMEAEEVLRPQRDAPQSAPAPSLADCLLEIGG